MANSMPVALSSDQSALSTVAGSSTKTTYMASITGLAPAVSSTDLLELSGSASKTVKV